VEKNWCLLEKRNVFENYVIRKAVTKEDFIDKGVMKKDVTEKAVFEKSFLDKAIQYCYWEKVLIHMEHAHFHAHL
jgi:hypothetical protein